MHPRRSARVLLACAALALGACGENATERDATARREQAAALARDPELTDPLGRAVLAQAQQHAPGWLKHERLFRGRLTQGQRQAFLAILALGHCYRFFGAGGDGALDLDLKLVDANGVEVARDVSEDPRPNLGVAASICPGDASAVTIEVRMRRGQGEFALAVFRSPD